MKKLLIIIGMILSINTLFAFATVMAPAGGDPITFTTSVSGVDVYLNGQQIGKIDGTQYMIKVKRDDETKTLTFKKDGYKDTTVVLTKTLSNMFWGNFFIGGSIGSSVDSWTTKQNMEYSPNQYYVTMSK